ncbi:TetR/AcrR family transcriptional regulator [Dactylosporangium sp. CA-233914]|uniref:TetR/AcrR family transcriptional regulator n=1 Tax=Dactylosporangium sp. CA-233914 TaxID=3239934 RepID=UPI003D9083ED
MSRPLRADAARNRRLLLAAAADEFAERGLEASIADIARRAGIGKGTVFRHFATKEDLIAAIVLDRVEVLVEAGDHLREAEDPGAALLEFMTVAAEQRQQRDLSFLHRANEGNAEVSRVQERLRQTIDALADRAREEGALRDDVTGTDLFLLMCAPNHVAGHHPGAPPDLWRRYLAIIFDGLRPQGAHPLPHPAPDARAAQGPDARTTEGPGAQTTERPDARAAQGPDARTTEGPGAQTTERPDARTAQGAGAGPAQKPGTRAGAVHAAADEGAR